MQNSEFRRQKTRSVSSLYWAIVLAALVFFSASSAVLAQVQSKPNPLGGTIEGPGGIGEVTGEGGKGSLGGYGIALAKVFSQIVGFLTILIGLFFIVYFIIAAFNWTASGGDQQKLENARNKMSQAFIGLTLAVAAYSIIYIIGQILGVNFLKLDCLLRIISPSPDPC